MVVLLPLLAIELIFVHFIHDHVLVGHEGSILLFIGLDPIDMSHSFKFIHVDSPMKLDINQHVKKIEDVWGRL